MEWHIQVDTDADTEVDPLLAWPPPASLVPLLPPRPTRKHLLHRPRPKTETENPKSVRQVFPRRRLSLQKCLIKATSETQPQNGNKN